MDNKSYYESYDWSVIHRTNLEPLISALSEIIPGDVQNIIDVGCGNGVITTELAKKYRVLGVDRSQAALSLLETDKLQASCDDIPLNNESFDLVLSTELLEHLEDDVFMRTLEEFRRLARKYILITVPNHENLDKYILKCPACGYVFNRSYHLRSFSKDQITNIFPDYKMISYKILGAEIRHYNRVLSGIKKTMTPSSSWIPLFWTPEGKRHSMCPSCEHHFEYPYRKNLFTLGLDYINVIISRKKPYWQMVLFEKM